MSVWCVLVVGLSASDVGTRSLCGARVSLRATCVPLAAARGVAPEPESRSSGQLWMAASGPPILPKRAWQVAISGAVCGALLITLQQAPPPNLFALHVASMAPMLPLGTAAVSTVRQRLTRPTTKLPDAAARRRRGEWLMIRHFVASALALYIAAFGLVAIALHKNALGRPHLSTAHSRLGAAAWLLWLLAYVSAQPHVWRDQWRDRAFSLLRNKRWLWSSPPHRRLGLLAYVFSLLAYASGVLGWGAVDRRLALASCSAVGAIGWTTINYHGLHEIQRAVLSIARRAGSAALAICRRAGLR